MSTPVIISSLIDHNGFRLDGEQVMMVLWGDLQVI